VPPFSSSRLQLLPVATPGAAPWSPGARPPEREASRVPPSRPTLVPVPPTDDRNSRDAVRERERERDALANVVALGDETERLAIARLRAGETEALGKLYDLHHKAVRTFAVRFLGDAAAAEDLVHDVFVALPRSLASYRGEKGLRSYLVAMAANLSKNHVRAAARRRSLAIRAGHEPQRAPSLPDEAIQRAQLTTRLQRALDELSHEHRVTFVLCALEDRSSPEVAEMLTIPEATVRTRLFHAKKRLREILENDR
jgi:RNA polymerase sigma-70 factor, ECF subfamily